jgi:hypothetical protein
VSEVDENGDKRPVAEQCTALARDYFQPEDWYTNGALVGYVQGAWLKTFEPSNAQRKSMIRALHSFVRKFPQYALMGGTGRKSLLLYEPGDPVSAAWAKEMLTRSFCSLDEARELARSTLT